MVIISGDSGNYDLSKIFLPLIRNAYIRDSINRESSSYITAVFLGNISSKYEESLLVSVPEFYEFSMLGATHCAFLEVGSDYDVMTIESSSLNT